MANYLDSASLPVAAPEKNKFDLGMQHITTSDFMELDCAYVKEMVPGEKIDLNMETFSRMNAMPVPTFGRAVIKKSKYFVPMRQVFPAFTDFVSDTVHINAAFDASGNTIPSAIPQITNDDLVQLFIGDATAPTSGDVAYNSEAMCYPVGGLNDSHFDFFLTYDTNVSGQSSGNRYRFTNVGRQVYKLLLALGYDIVWTNIKVGSTGYFDKSYSLLPLLAFIKLYADWYWPSQYANATLYKNMMMLCRRDNGSVSVNGLYEYLRPILKQIGFVQYDSNYFVSCWDMPNQPTQGNYSTFTLNNIDTVGKFYRNNLVNANSENGFITNNAGDPNSTLPIGDLNAPFAVGKIQGSAQMGGVVSEYLLKGLKALTAFMKRNQLVGSRAYERMMLRYGVPTPGEKLNRAVFLGSETQAIQIGDIFSTSDTEGAELGKFAGKGMSYGTTHLSYETDEFGYVFVVTSIVPMASTYQGIDPMVMRLDRTDFYQPEFDSLGVEAVPAMALYTPKVYNYNYANQGQQVFGFLPRYSAYKSAVKDKLTGNFRVASLNGTSSWLPNVVNGASSWHLMREFDELQYPSSSAITHSLDFMYGYKDFWQYKRMFYGGSVVPISVDGDDFDVAPDNFTLIHNFEVASYAPMKKLYDVVDELNADDEHTHKRLSMQIGGVKVN